MATIIGNLTFDDNDRVFATTEGQRIIWDLIQSELARHNADLAAQIGVFVSGATEAFKERYKLPMTGRMQERGLYTRAAQVKRYGGWDVGYDLRDFGDSISGDDVSLAYMMAKDLRSHLDGIYLRNVNTMRWWILYTLFNNTQKTISDELRGSFYVEPLANGDAVVYPPVLGSEDEATEDHYLESGYVYTNISSTNNPCTTVRDELEHHFGQPTGMSNIVFFVPTVVADKIAATLTGFSAVTPRYVQPGDDTAKAVSLPNVPGRIRGYCDGVWIVEWAWMPTAANPYGFAIHMDAEAPLKMRVDPADTGLGRGLQLVSRDNDYPFQTSEWRHRYGFGVGNRLNGVAFEFHTGGTYTIPTPYA